MIFTTVFTCYPEPTPIEQRAMNHLNHASKNSGLYLAARRVCVRVFGEYDTQRLERDRERYCHPIQPLFSVKYSYASMGPFKYQAAIKNVHCGLLYVIARSTPKEMYKEAQRALRCEYWRAQEQVNI